MYKSITHFPRAPLRNTIPDLEGFEDHLTALGYSIAFGISGAVMPLASVYVITPNPALGLPFWKSNHIIMSLFAPESDYTS